MKGDEPPLLESSENLVAILTQDVPGTRSIMCMFRWLFLLIGYRHGTVYHN
jgi:hypothetical protein